MRTLALMLVLLGCADSHGTRMQERTGHDAGDQDASAHDAGSDEPAPDASTECRNDDECDDGVECTRDTCSNHQCVSARDDDFCSDRRFCNGDEICDVVAGCRPGKPRTCDDRDACTIDSCDEKKQACVHAPRTGQEICDDGSDNDCDAKIDEGDCRVAHDRCEDALDVSAGGKFSLDLAGAMTDYEIECGDGGDVAVTFELDSPRDVTLNASGLLDDGSAEELASIAIRRDCSTVDSEFECNRSVPGQVRMRALPAGRYFAIVSDSRLSKVDIEVRLDAPTKAPANVDCQHPRDVSKGGHLSGNFVDVGDDLSIACGYSGASDLVYSFTTDAVRDVEIAATSASGNRMNFAVRSTCADAASTVRCVSDAPARARLYQLPAGTYYIVLESSPLREVDFDLDIAFLDPTDPPQGDGCSHPLELPLSTEVDATTADREDLIAVTCGCDAAEPHCNQFWRDVTYHVKVDEATDLGLTVNSASALMQYDFRSTCETSAAPGQCGQGTMISRRIRNVPAGDYYLVLESFDPVPFTVQVDPLPLTVPVTASGNDLCSDAIEIPATGGLFSGDTGSLKNDYVPLCGGDASSKDATFHLTLAQKANVKATLEAPFDTVLYRFTDRGDGADACQSKMDDVCNDDVNAQGDHNSLLSESLDAGSYYYVVDGFNDNAGAYLLEVTVTPE